MHTPTWRETRPIPWCCTPPTRTGPFPTWSTGGAPWGLPLPSLPPHPISCPRLANTTATNAATTMRHRPLGTFARPPPPTPPPRSPRPLSTSEHAAAPVQPLGHRIQTYAETQYDRLRLARICRTLRRTAPWCGTVDVDAAERWRDRWRVPLTLRGDGGGGGGGDGGDGDPANETVHLTETHFATVRAAGAALVVEERFDARQMNAYYLDMNRTFFRGWRAWTVRERVQCVVATVTCCASTAMVLGWYLWDVWVESGWWQWAVAAAADETAGE